MCKEKRTDKKMPSMMAWQQMEVQAYAVSEEHKKGQLLFSRADARGQGCK